MPLRIRQYKLGKQDTKPPQRVLKEALEVFQSTKNSIKRYERKLMDIERILQSIHNKMEQKIFCIKITASQKIPLDKKHIAFKQSKMRIEQAEIFIQKSVNAIRDTEPKKQKAKEIKEDIENVIKKLELEVKKTGRIKGNFQVKIQNIEKFILESEEIIQQLNQVNCKAGGVVQKAEMEIKENQEAIQVSKEMIHDAEIVMEVMIHKK